LIADLKTSTDGENKRPARQPATPSGETPSGEQTSQTDLMRYSERVVAQDSSWVQFHLDANQLRYNVADSEDAAKTALEASMERLKQHARLASMRTGSGSLRQAIQTTVLGN